MPEEILSHYADLVGRVRGRELQAIRALVQPDDPEVREVANVLAQSPDFVSACQDFVHSFTTYRREIGEFWATPAETMAPLCPKCLAATVIPVDGDEETYQCQVCGWRGTPIRAGDCDDKAILLVSLLRTRLPADKVFCAFGVHRNSRAEGHMWVIMDGEYHDRIIEATASSESLIRGEYELMAFFNDELAFAYPSGIKAFNLIPVKEAVYV